MRWFRSTPSSRLQYFSTAVFTALCVKTSSTPQLTPRHVISSHLFFQRTKAFLRLPSEFFQRLCSGNISLWGCDISKNPSLCLCFSDHEETNLQKTDLGGKGCEPGFLFKQAAVIRDNIVPTQTPRLVIYWGERGQWTADSHSLRHLFDVSGQYLCEQPSSAAHVQNYCQSPSNTHIHTHKGLTSPPYIDCLTDCHGLHPESSSVSEKVHWCNGL